MIVNLSSPFSVIQASGWPRLNDFVFKRRARSCSHQHFLDQCNLVIALLSKKLLNLESQFKSLRGGPSNEALELTIKIDLLTTLLARMKVRKDSFPSDYNYFELSLKIEEVLIVLKKEGW